MSFQIDRGLFQLDFIDHHAILGVAIDAETKDIRKRYLKVARRLHPDSFSSESEADKQRASDLLSKLVNPAWEKLSQEKDRVEYELLLKLKGQQALRQKNSLQLSELAKQLLTASNPSHFYRVSLKGLAERQYEHLDHALELTAQISELNVVYLMRQENQSEVVTSEPKKTLYTGSNIPDSSQSPTSPVAPKATASAPPRRESLADQYYRRAEAHVAKNNYAQATLELRDALKIDPKSSRCHSLMGMVYLKQNQLTMAKIHFNKALEIEPQNTMALEGKQKLEAPPKATGTGGKADAKKGTTKTNPSDSGKSGGGLFGLFGGKKK